MLFLDNMRLGLMEFSISSASAEQQQNILGQGLRRAQAPAGKAGAVQPLAGPPLPLSKYLCFQISHLKA